MAQSFDAKALRTTGEAVPVAERVETFLNNGTGAFSVSTTGILAYQTGMGDVGQLTWFDRSGKVIGILGEPRRYFHIELFPDQKSLAATLLPNGNLDVWKYDLAGGPPAHFTFDPAAEVTAVGSPDGRSIGFNSNRKGGTDLYLKAATGAGSEELLYADEQDKNPTSWSRDGKFILYHTTATQLAHLFALPMIPEQPGIAQARAGPPSQVQHLVGAIFPGWEMGGI